MPLAAGTAAFTSASATNIVITCSVATGGTSPYTYQWYSSTTAAFTPGVGNIVSGATSLTLTDTTPIAGTLYYYKLVATDSASATATSNQVAGQVLYPTISFGGLGDSIMFGFGLSAGLGAFSQMQLAYAERNRYTNVAINNQAISGTTTAAWLPPGSHIVTAVASFTGTVNYIQIMLGANDAATSNHFSAATYASNMSSIIAYLLANVAGLKAVILHYPTYIQAGGGGATDETSTSLTQQYRTQIDGLINGTTILAGDKLSPGFFADNLADLQSDLTHPNAVGAVALGIMWANATYAAINSSLAISGSRIFSGF